MNIYTKPDMSVVSADTRIRTHRKSSHMFIRLLLVYCVFLTCGAAKSGSLRAIYKTLPHYHAKAAQYKTLILVEPLM